MIRISQRKCDFRGQFKIIAVKLVMCVGYPKFGLSPIGYYTGNQSEKRLLEHGFFLIFDVFSIREGEKMEKKLVQFTFNPLLYYMALPKSKFRVLDPSLLY